MYRICIYKFFVSFLYSVYFIDISLNGCILCNGLYGGGSFLFQLFHVVRRYDSCLVDFLQGLLYMPFVVGIFLDNERFIVVVFFQFLYHFLARFSIEVIVWRIEFENTVLFCFYLLFTLIYRKIE